MLAVYRERPERFKSRTADQGRRTELYWSFLG